MLLLCTRGEDVKMSITQKELRYVVCPSCNRAFTVAILDNVGQIYHHCNQCGTHFDTFGNRLSLWNIEKLSKEFPVAKSKEIKRPYLIGKKTWGLP